MGSKRKLKDLFGEIGRICYKIPELDRCFEEILKALLASVGGKSACISAEFPNFLCISCGEGDTDFLERYTEEARESAIFGEQLFIPIHEIASSDSSGPDIPETTGVLYPLLDGDRMFGVIAIYGLEGPMGKLHDLIASTAIPYLSKIYLEKFRDAGANFDSGSALPQPDDTRLATVSEQGRNEYDAIVQNIARRIIEDSPLPPEADALRKALRLHSCLIFLMDRIENMFLIKAMSTKATRVESRLIESVRISPTDLQTAGYSQSDLHQLHTTSIDEYLVAANASGPSSRKIVAAFEKYRKHRVIRVPLFDSFRRLQGFILLIREPNQKAFPQEVKLANDIGARLSNAFEIRNSIYFDLLTGLPNLGRIRPAAIDFLISSELFGLIICKLINLKDIVIARGDDFVDRCMVATARKIRRYTEHKTQNALVGRNSGEASFTFIIPGADTERMRTFIHGLIECIAEPIEVDGGQVYLHSNVGACLSADIWDSDMVFNYSKLAIQSISPEKNAYCIFDAEKQQAYQDEVELEGDLLASMTQRRFLPHYQPKVACDGCVVGYEALVRWSRNDRLEFPGLFVEKVEKMGLIQPLFEIMLERVCKELSDGADLRSVSINVSPYQLSNPELIRNIREQMSFYHVDPGMITFEFVETAIVNSDYFETISELKALGFKLSLDDFGTGFAQYKTLIDLFNQGFIHEIKIDKVFVDNIESRANQNFVRSISYLAAEFGIQIVIEGVETIDQFQLLRSIDPSFVIQGWLVSKALSIEQVSQFDEQNVQDMFSNA